MLLVLEQCLICLAIRVQHRLSDSGRIMLSFSTPSSVQQTELGSAEVACGACHRSSRRSKLRQMQRLIAFGVGCLIRYRSQLCNDGPKCRRRVCFFAHTIDQLRVPSSKPLGAAEAPDLPVQTQLPRKSQHQEVRASAYGKVCSDWQRVISPVVTMIWGVHSGSGRF